MRIGILLSQKRKSDVVLNMEKECPANSQGTQSTYHILALILKKINRNVEVFYGKFFNNSNGSQAEKQL